MLKEKVEKRNEERKKWETRKKKKKAYLEKEEQNYRANEKMESEEKDENK